MRDVRMMECGAGLSAEPVGDVLALIRDKKKKKDRDILRVHHILT